MKACWNATVRRPVILLLLALGSANLYAQSAAAAPRPASWGGLWLMEIQGTFDTRTLSIPDVPLPGDEGGSVVISYATTGGALSPVSMQITGPAGSRQIGFTTPGGIAVAATEQADGSFKAKLTYKNGTLRDATIARTTEAEVKRIASVDPRVPVPPAPTVPAECAALHGTWLGRWARGNYEMYLRIVETVVQGGVCTVRLSYSRSATPVAARTAAVVKDDSMSFLCNLSTAGTCYFKRRDESLWASYASSSGTNSANFKKVDQP